jgi:hypothetical protein
MKILECKQKSAEWMIARAGVPTASEFDALLTPKLEPRKGQTVETYLARKLSEWWIGGPLPQVGSYYMEQGTILEDEAIPWYELETGRTVTRIGYITTDDGRVGCSPDGVLMLEGGVYGAGIEIKCPAIHTHVSWLLDGVLPTEHAAQVYGSMWVTGLSEWYFLSYHRGLPALRVTVSQDGAILGRIGEALESFLAKLDAGKKRLIEINGGEPKRSKPLPNWQHAEDPEFMR